MPPYFQVASLGPNRSEQLCTNSDSEYTSNPRQDPAESLDRVCFGADFVHLVSEERW